MCKYYGCVSHSTNNTFNTWLGPYFPNQIHQVHWEGTLYGSPRIELNNSQQGISSHIYFEIDDLVWYQGIGNSYTHTSRNLEDALPFRDIFRDIANLPEDTGIFIYRRKRTTYSVAPIALIVIILIMIGGYWLCRIPVCTTCPPPIPRDTITIPSSQPPPTDTAWQFEDLLGTANGKKAKFRIAVISQEFRWDYASDSTANGQPIQTRFLPYVAKLPKFNEAKGIIAVGVASQEGNISAEEIRADSRADNLLIILKVHPITQDKPFYKLRLGRHQPFRGNVSRNETAYQRRVILIGIMEQDPSMNNKEVSIALENALNSEVGKFLRKENYSRFELLPFDQEKN